MHSWYYYTVSIQKKHKLEVICTNFCEFTGKWHIFGTAQGTYGVQHFNWRSSLGRQSFLCSILFFSCSKEEKKPICIRQCIETVTQKFCECLPLISLKNNHQETEQDKELPFCTPHHFINCSGKAVGKSDKCYSEKCLTDCNHRVFQLTPRIDIFGREEDVWAEDYDSGAASLLRLHLCAPDTQQYPVFEEVYPKNWESFIGELGQFNNVLKYTQSSRQGPVGIPWLDLLTIFC